MRMRNLATLERYFKDGSRGDANYMALGFAGYVRAMEAKGRTELLEDWENDLLFPGFLPAVRNYLEQLKQRPILEVLELLNTDKIGRASCRERVCQDV